MGIHVCFWNFSTFPFQLTWNNVFFPVLVIDIWGFSALLLAIWSRNWIDMSLLALEACQLLTRNFLNLLSFLYQWFLHLLLCELLIIKSRVIMYYFFFFHLVLLVGSFGEGSCIHVTSMKHVESYILLLVSGKAYWWNCVWFKLWKRQPNWVWAWYWTSDQRFVTLLVATDFWNS